MKKIAVITQTTEMFRNWMRVNKKEGFEYIHVYREDHLRGIKISDYFLHTEGFKGGFAFTSQRRLVELAKSRVV